MKAMIIAFIAVAAIAVAADVALDRIGFSAEDRTAGSAVRLD